MTMAGYRRPHGTTESLSATVITALRDHPTERLGQLLCNALGVHDETLFMMHDEFSEARLREYCENEPNAFGCEYAHLANGGCALAVTADSPPPSSVQLLDLLHELDSLRGRLQGAVDLVIRFDRHAADLAEYPGSPFKDEVDDFLTTMGR